MLYELLLALALDSAFANFSIASAAFLHSEILCFTGHHGLMISSGRLRIGSLPLRLLPSCHSCQNYSMVRNILSCGILCLCSACSCSGSPPCMAALLPAACLAAAACCPSSCAPNAAACRQLVIYLSHVKRWLPGTAAAPASGGSNGCWIVTVEIWKRAVLHGRD